MSRAYEYHSGAQTSVLEGALRPHRRFCEAALEHVEHTFNSQIPLASVGQLNELSGLRLYERGDVYPLIPQNILRCLDKPEAFTVKMDGVCGLPFIPKAGLLEPEKGSESAVSLALGLAHPVALRSVKDICAALLQHSRLRSHYLWH